MFDCMDQNGIVLEKQQQLKTFIFKNNYDTDALGEDFEDEQDSNIKQFINNTLYYDFIKQFLHDSKRMKYIICFRLFSQIKNCLKNSSEFIIQYRIYIFLLGLL